MFMRMLAAAVAAGPSLCCCLPLAADAADYTGRWAVELVTDSGPCQARYDYAVSIDGGEVRLLSGGDGAKVGGRVGADGHVGLDVAKGGASGSGTGRLDAGRGSGTWQVTALCSGRWTARRDAGQTARAD